MNNCGTEEVRDTTIGIEIVKFAAKLAGMQEELAVKVHEKLAPVMLCSENPTSCEKKKDEEQREYPPLFAELRNSLQRIENSLYVIRDAISWTMI